MEGIRYERGEAAPPIRRRPARVLLVDDDDSVSRFFNSRLEKCGIDVAYAADFTRRRPIRPPAGTNPSSS